MKRVKVRRRLCTPTEIFKTFRDSKDVQPAIPAGLKSDVIFVINNSSNVARREKKQRSLFADDCGVWMSKASVTTKTAFIIGDDGCLTFTRLINDVASVVRTKIWCALDPQPATDKLVVIARSYANLKDDATYQRRISWMESGPDDVLSRKLAVVEYDGQAPSSTSSHGNAKQCQASTSIQTNG